MSDQQQITLHGVFLEVFDLGVLLTGPSGIGKSELALGLINRGHKLIADDAVDFILQKDGLVTGNCHPILQDFLEVRGLGPLNIRAMYGDFAIKDHHSLDLIVYINKLSDKELIDMDRLHGLYRNCDILGTAIPEVTIPVYAGRDLDVLVEAAVRNQVLKKDGYNASEVFCKRQRDYTDIT